LPVKVFPDEVAAPGHRFALAVDRQRGAGDRRWGSWAFQVIVSVEVDTTTLPMVWAGLCRVGIVEHERARVGRFIALAVGGGNE